MNSNTSPSEAHAAVEEHDTVLHRLVEVLMGPVLEDEREAEKSASAPTHRSCSLLPWGL